jgi:hypothetical protein
MKEVWFSIAGVNFDFISHGAAAEYLFDELPNLLPGFLINKKKATDAVCLVHFDHEQKYPLRFHSEPHLIRSEDSRTNEAIFTRMGKAFFTCPSNSSEIIGFLNGCLSFDDRSNRGLIYIFCSAGTNHFVATLLKLLFVFTCLVMINKGRLMVHGAGIKKRKGGGYVFIGISGKGKSTIAALSSDDKVLSDDATVIEVAGDACRIHATPFRQLGSGQPSPSKLHLEQERLKKLLFIHHSATTFIQHRDQRIAFTELLKEHLHCFEVMGEPLKRQAFYLCRAVCIMTPSYDLFFRKDHSFWEHVLAK